MLKRALFMLLGIMVGLLIAHIFKVSMTSPELILLVSGSLVFFVVVGEFVPGGREGKKIQIVDEVPEEEIAWLMSKGTEPKSGFPLKKEVVLVGRSIGSDILLNDKSISRRHAQIIKGPDGFVIKDLDSRNGTFVNNKRVEEHLIRDNDEVSLGNLSFNFLYPASMKKNRPQLKPETEIKAPQPPRNAQPTVTLTKSRAGNE